MPADQIQLEVGIPVYDGCLSEFDEDFKPHNVVELMIDEKVSRWLYRHHKCTWS